MIKFKKKETNNSLIRVKCISAQIYELLRLLDKNNLSINTLYSYKGLDVGLDEYTLNSDMVKDIHNLLYNSVNDLINLSHIKIIYDVKEIKCIHFDKFYFFKALFLSVEKTAYFLTNDKQFIEKYIKK